MRKRKKMTPCENQTAYLADLEKKCAALVKQLDTMRGERDELQTHCDRLTGMKFSDRMHAALKSRAEAAEAERDELKKQLECRSFQPCRNDNCLEEKQSAEAREKELERERDELREVMESLPEWTWDKGADFPYGHCTLRCGGDVAKGHTPECLRRKYPELAKQS